MTLREIAAEAGVIDFNSLTCKSIKVLIAREQGSSRPYMGNKPNVPIYSKTFKKNTVEPDSSSTEPFRSIACLFARVPDGASDYFFSTLAKNIEQEAFRHNYIFKVHIFCFLISMILLLYS